MRDGPPWHRRRKRHLHDALSLRRGAAPSIHAARALVVAAFALLFPFTATAHEHREVGDYTLVVGFIAEPAIQDDTNGIWLSVTKGETPVTGLADTLQAQILFGDQSKDMALVPAFGEDGTYEAVFIPTEPGDYTFRFTAPSMGSMSTKLSPRRRKASIRWRLDPSSNSRAPMTMAPAKQEPPPRDAAGNWRPDRAGRRRGVDCPTPFRLIGASHSTTYRAPHQLVRRPAHVARPRISRGVARRQGPSCQSFLP